MKGVERDALQMKWLARMTNHKEESPNFSPHKASVSLNPTSVLIKIVLIITTE